MSVPLERKFGFCLAKKEKTAPSRHSWTLGTARAGITASLNVLRYSDTQEIISACLIGLNPARQTKCGNSLSLFVTAAGLYVSQAHGPWLRLSQSLQLAAVP